MKITKIFGTWASADDGTDWSLSACPCAKISVKDFSNFQGVHLSLERGVAHALKLDP